MRERAGWRCDWCRAEHGKPHPRTGSKVILTVAHLGAARPEDFAAGRCWGDPHDKHDVRPENLAALCQSCHLGYDHDDHVRNAAASRRRKRLEAGQLALGEEEDERGTLDEGGAHGRRTDRLAHGRGDTTQDAQGRNARANPQRDRPRLSRAVRAEPHARGAGGGDHRDRVREGGPT